ncbi:MAG TPA: mannosyltransferase family protein, partial [Thermomicrobiales bacterium]|nr:mannosyltransferase family protein [Thermomicrobiales bacterium]
IWWRVGITNPWPSEFAGMRLWRFSMRWDADWYVRIAEHGYTHVAGQASTVGFFPGFPVAVAVAGAVLPGGTAFAGLVVAHLALIAALIYVFLLARLEFGERVAWWTVGLLLMFPAGFFFSAVFPESLLLLGIAAALYHARRGQWWRAGLFGLLAGATGLAGMLIVVPLALELWRQEGGRRIDVRDIVAVAIAPLGGLAYFGYLWARFGSPLVYFDSIAAYRRDIRAFDSYRNGTGGSLDNVFAVSDAALIGVFLIAGALLWWRVRPSYGALVIGLTLLPLVVGAPPGIGRQLVVAFPAFMLLGRIPSEGVRMMLSAVFSLGLMLTAFFFVQGFWAG